MASRLSWLRIVSDTETIPGTVGAGTTGRTRQLPSFLGRPVVRVVAIVALAVVYGWLVPHGALPAYPGDSWVLQGVGIAFALCGIAAWWRRPRDFIGPTMMLFALVWWSNFWETTAPDALRFTIAALIDSAPPLLLAYMLLAFPEGRLRGWAAKLTVALAACEYLSKAALAPLYDPRQAGCTHCGPHTNLILISGDTSSGQVRDEILQWALPGLAAAIAATMIIRFVRASAVERRVIGPLYLPAMIWALTWMVSQLIPHFAGSGFISADPLGQALFKTWNYALLVVPLTFLYGMQRTRGRRTRVADLVRELGATPSLVGLERALSKTLGDPSLKVGLAVGNGYLRPDLSPLDRPAPDDLVTWTPLNVGERRVGVLVHDRALLLDDRELLEAVAAAAQLAVDNDRLQEEVRQQLEALKESRSRILAAADDARRGIERNLHDGAQQRLVSLLVALRLAEMQVGPDGDAGLQATLRDMGEQLDAAIDELRDIARGLHPSILTEKGLAAAVRALADRAPLPVLIEHVPVQRLSPAVEAAAYYVVAEALTNTARYARAEQVRVDIRTSADSLTVAVSDDGRGGASLEKGSGLRGLADRVEAAGGQLQIDSPIGDGTTVRAVLPCVTPSSGLATACDQPSASVSLAESRRPS